MHVYLISVNLMLHDITAHALGSYPMPSPSEYAYRNDQHWRWKRPGSEVIIDTLDCKLTEQLSSYREYNGMHCFPLLIKLYPLHQEKHTLILMMHHPKLQYVIL